MPSDRHALLPVYQQGVCLDLDVLLQPRLVLHELGQGAVGLLQLVLQVLEAGGQLGHLLEQLPVRVIVTVLHLRPPRALLQPGLGHAQRRVFRGNVLLDALNMSLHIGDFLKVNQFSP